MLVDAGSADGHRSLDATCAICDVRWCQTPPQIPAYRLYLLCQHSGHCLTSKSPWQSMPSLRPLFAHVCTTMYIVWPMIPSSFGTGNYGHPNSFANPPECRESPRSPPRPYHAICFATFMKASNCCNQRLVRIIHLSQQMTHAGLTSIHAITSCTSDRSVLGSGLQMLRVDGEQIFALFMSLGCPLLTDENRIVDSKSCNTMQC